MRGLLAVVAIIVSNTTVEADLVANASFENVPNSTHNQGLMPSGWQHVVGSALPASDTYSNDGSYGLSPSDFGNFNGITAYDGIRWVAGYSYDRTATDASLGNEGFEAFGTTLTGLLSAGAEYQLDARLRESVRFRNRGGYQLFLAESNSVPGIAGAVLLGAIAPTTGINEWESRSLTFVAPTDAASRPFLIFAPYKVSAESSYVGLDAVSLTQPNLQSVPEPSCLVLLGISSLGLLAGVDRRRRRACI